MKKKLMSLLAALILVCGFPFGASGATLYEPDTEVAANAVYLYNIDTNSVIYAKNESEVKYPASLTKIMTCILALENTKDLDKEIVVLPKYVESELYDYQREHGSISLGGVVAGEELTMRQALYALMLPSANEVAMAIADHIAGSQDSFAQMMTQRAKDLGAKNTNFVNPNGLFDEAHVTTAYDMAQITLHAIGLPGFMDIVSTVTYDSGPTNKHENLNWSTTNYMMVQGNSYYNSRVKGVKTGSLPEAGKCFISTASHGGYTYLLVLMDTPYFQDDGVAMRPDNLAFTDANNIYNWVFDTFEVKTLREHGEYVAEVKVRYNMEQDTVPLMMGSRFSALVPEQVSKTDVTVRAEIPEYIDAPVTKGQYVGEGILMLAGEEIGRVELQAAENVSASQILIVTDFVSNIVGNPKFWLRFGVIFLILLVVYIVLMIRRNRRRRRGGSYRPRRRI